MTRQKKLERDTQVESLIYLLIEQTGVFDWWLAEDQWLFETVSYTLNCSIHLVKRIFYKKILLNDYEWLMNFTY